MASDWRWDRRWRRIDNLPDADSHRVEQLAQKIPEGDALRHRTSAYPRYSWAHNPRALPCGIERRRGKRSPLAKPYQLFCGQLRNVMDLEAYYRPRHRRAL